MIMDENLEFADALAVNAAAGTALVGDVIDLDTIGRRIGAGSLYLVIQVNAAFTSGGAATVSFKLASDAAAAVSTTTSTVHAQTAAIPVASLVAGARIILELPAGNVPAYERFLGLLVVTATATTTAGSIDAFLTNDAADWAALPDAVN